MKTQIALLMMIGSVAAACSTEIGEPIEGEEVGEVGEAAICTAGEMKYKWEAQLAANVAKELKRWEADVDFEIKNPGSTGAYIGLKSGYTGGTPMGNTCNYQPGQCASGSSCSYVQDPVTYAGKHICKTSCTSDSQCAGVAGSVCYQGACSSPRVAIGTTRCAETGNGACPRTQAILDLQFNGEPEIPGHNETAFRNILVAHMSEHLSNVQNKKLPIADAIDLAYDTSSYLCDDGDGATMDMHWYKVNLPSSQLSSVKYKLAAYGSRPTGTNPENPFLNFSTAEGKVGIDPLGEDGTSGGTTGGASCDTNPYYKCDPSGYQWTGLCCKQQTGAPGKYYKVTTTSWYCKP